MARKCIFYGKEGDLSKEHLWPDWIGKVFPKHKRQKHSRGAQTFINKKVLRDDVNERSGAVITLKNRVVCQDCNNGWMSVVESETKSILLKMINGPKCKLSQAELEKLSFWITLKIVTAEHADKKEKLLVTPFEERHAMMVERKIPPHFNIYVGGHSTGQNSAWLRHSWTMAFSPEGPIPALAGRERNSQAISFIIGPIFIYVLQARLLGFVPEQHFKFGKLKRIWPSKMHFLKWPQKRLKRIETDIIAYMALDLIENSKHIHELPS